MRDRSLHGVLGVHGSIGSSQKYQACVHSCHFIESLLVNRAISNLIPTPSNAYQARSVVAQLCTPHARTPKAKKQSSLKTRSSSIR